MKTLNLASRASLLLFSLCACSAEEGGGSTNTAPTQPVAAPTQPAAAQTQPMTAATPAATGKTPMTPPSLDPFATACTGTNAKGISNDNTQFPGVQGLYFYSDQATKEGDTDKTTTMCVDPTQPGAICISGIGADSSNGLEGGDYAHWGAGLGLQLAVTNSGGVVQMPFDATALGLAGFRLFIAGVTPETAAIRIQVSMVDDPNILEDSKNLQQNAFLEGVDEANDLTESGMIEVRFADLKLPSWTNVVDTMLPFDPTRMHSLQFQVVTEPGTAHPYSFCIADLEWFDEAGNTVAVPVPVIPDETMPAATATTPVDPAPAPTDPAPVATDPAPAPTDTAPAATDTAPLPTDTAPMPTDTAPTSDTAPPASTATPP